MYALEKIELELDQKHGKPNSKMGVKQRKEISKPKGAQETQISSYHIQKINNSVEPHHVIFSVDLVISHAITCHNTF